MAFVISGDMGGENLRLGAFRPDGTELLEEVITYKVANHYETDKANLVEGINRLNRQGYGLLQGVGIAIAGNLDPTHSMLTAAGNLTGLVNKPLKSDLIRETGCEQILLGGDAYSAALAEAYYGHGRNGIDFLLIVIGTGVGGGWIEFHNGTPRPTKTEVGHLDLGWEPTPRQCGCGSTNCVECYLSGNGLEIRFGCRAEDLPIGIWRNEFLPRLVKLIANLAKGRDLPAVFFTGSVAVEQKWLLPIAEEQLKKTVTIVSPPLLGVSAFGKGAGIMGGRALLQHFAA